MGYTEETIEYLDYATTDLRRGTPMDITITIPSGSRPSAACRNSTTAFLSSENPKDPDLTYTIITNSSNIVTGIRITGTPSRATVLGGTYPFSYVSIYTESGPSSRPNTWRYKFHFYVRPKLVPLYLYAIGGDGTVTGAGTYEEGAIQTISAINGTNCRFSSWSDGGAQTHDIQIPTSVDYVEYTAYFEMGKTLSTSTTPAGVGTASISPQQSVYYQHTVITLNANITDGRYLVEKWTEYKPGGGPAHDLPNSASTSVQTEFNQNGDTTYTVYFRSKRYTLTYDTNGGTGTVVPAIVNYTDTLTIPANTFTRVGYTSAKSDGKDLWSTSGGVTYTSGVQPSGTYLGNDGETVTLYACWVANTYTIRFNANGGQGSMANQSRAYDDGVALTANAFTRPAHQFAGWRVGDPAAGPIYVDGAVENFSNVSGAVVDLYAVWIQYEVTVTFNANGGVYDTGNIVVVKTTVMNRIDEFPRSVTRPGYLLSGYMDSNGNTVTTQNAFVENTTLYADWVENTLTDEICYLTKYTGTGSSAQTMSVLELPTIQSVSKTYSANLVKKDTYLYGYDNKFVTDLGTQMTISISFKRAQPIPYDNSSTSQSQWSNAVWCNYFKQFTENWQNFNSDSAHRRLKGGYILNYSPKGEYSDLTEAMSKNVFLKGTTEFTFGSDPQSVSFTMTFAVGALMNEGNTGGYAVYFQDSDLSNSVWGASSNIVTKTTAVGTNFYFPTVDTSWALAKKAAGHFFLGWTHGHDTWGNTSEEIKELDPLYTPGYSLSQAAVQDKTFRAVWISATAQEIHHINEDSTFTSSLDRTYTIPSEYQDCAVSLLICGGGGAGGRGDDTGGETDYDIGGTWNPWDKRVDAGGGGGAGELIATSFHARGGQIIEIKGGAGGCVYHDSAHPDVNKYKNYGSPIDGEATVVRLLDGGIETVRVEASGGLGGQAYSYNTSPGGEKYVAGGTGGGHSSRAGANGSAGHGGTAGVGGAAVNESIALATKYWCGGGGGGAAAYASSKGGHGASKDTIPFFASSGDMLCGVWGGGGGGGQSPDVYFLPDGTVTISRYRAGNGGNGFVVITVTDLSV